MYRYNIDNRLVTAWSRIDAADAIEVFLTDAEAEKCIGFNQDGSPIFDETIIDRKNAIAKNAAIETIKNAFESDASTVGIEFNGVFYTIESGAAIFNPRFQYDFLSIQKLESVVSDARVPYWRTVDNKNLSLTLQNKTDLLELLKITYFSKFKESRDAIDAL